MSESSDNVPAFRPVALLAAAALPGLGHVITGERKRGLLAGGAILGLFFGGIFIGGIDVIDAREDTAWFAGQAFVGPLAFGVNHLHQNSLKVIDPRTKQPRSARPTEGRDATTGGPVANGTPPNRKSIGKMNEIGTLYAAIAGMLNLIVMIDAAAPVRRGRGS
jgi:hypothetical protein